MRPGLETPEQVGVLRLAFIPVRPFLQNAKAPLRKRVEMRTMRTGLEGEP